MIDQDTLAALLEKRRAKHHTLARLAEHLRGLKFPPPIAGKWAAESADAIERFLDGNEKSLDIAFRLNPKRGAPVRCRDEHKAIAREVLSMKLGGTSWKKISDTLSANNCTVADERSLRRIYRDFLADLVAEDTTLDEIMDLDSGA